MEYFYKVILYVLCMREKSKGSSNLYSLASSLSILSFFILLNVHSFLLLGEICVPSIFMQINDWVYNEENFIMTVIVLSFYHSFGFF